jgi:hypothetical protein
MGDIVRIDPAGSVPASGRRPVPSIPGEALWLERFSFLPAGGSSSSPSPVPSGRDRGDPSASIGWAVSGDGDDGPVTVMEACCKVPAGYAVTGVDIGLGTGAGTFLARLELAGGQGPAKTAVVLLDERGDSTDLGPVLVDNSTAARTADRDPVVLSLRLEVARSSDRVVVRGLSLRLGRR